MIPSVELRNISKRFGDTLANDGISLSLSSGKITAILGENGAGKSTLMSILAGKVQADSGTLFLKGMETSLRSTKDAIQAGIGMVYQHFTLVEAMTVAENIFLGQTTGHLIHPQDIEQQVKSMAQEYMLPVDPTRQVHDLSMGEKQRVEILKLLYRENNILIFDEPTAVLTPHEIKQLFQAMRTMADQGKTIVFISHKLKEVMEIADRIAILRQGKIVEEMDRAEVDSVSLLAQKMVGREVIFDVERPLQDTGDMVLEVKGLSGGILSNVSFSLRQGEILSLVGVAGNGQKPLVEILTGLSSPEQGEVALMGKPWDVFFSTPLLYRALSYIPEDRLGRGTTPNLDLLDNFLMTSRDEFTRFGLLDRVRAGAVCKAAMEKFNVHPPFPTVLARRLSGGNLQKMVLARELHRNPQLILCEQPTQGLDIAATEEVWKQLLKAREHAGILLITGDISEALRLSDRVGVLFQGRIMDIFSGDNQEKHQEIGPMMAGLH